jgi:hypothetical protein
MTNSDPQDLLRLADEVAAAVGPDTALDHRIADALHDWRNLGGWREQHKITGEVRSFSYRPAPAYTASLDAAMTLIGKDAYWRLGNDGEGTDVSAFKATVTSGDGPTLAFHDAVAATPALALASAALKARAHSIKDTSNVG